MEKDFILSEERYEETGEELGMSLYRAIDKQTGKDVTICKMDWKKLDPEICTKYETEMYKLCNSKHMFIVQNHGYTNGENPFLVSDYSETSLREILDNWNSKELSWYDDTRRTTYVLGIIKGMQYLSSVGIHHGFLVPSNVMLPNFDQICPQLIKFGLSEFLPGDEQPWKESGDEVLTEKSDVWSFGFLLSEIVNHREVSRKTKSIQKVITRCMDADPANRPTFSELWELFASGSVTFPDADLDYISKVVAYIEDKESRQKRRKYKKLATITDTFETDVDAAVMNLNPSDAIHFFKIIALHFSEETDKYVFGYLLGICDELTRNPAYSYAFVEASLHERLPFNRRDLVELTFPILWNVIYYNINIVDDNMARVIMYLLQVSEEKVLYLVGCYARRFNEISNPWTLLDMMLLQWKKIENEQPKFIAIFHYLCRFYPIYKAKRLDSCAKIIANLAMSGNDDTEASALAFLCEFCPRNPPISIQNLVSLMRKKNASSSAITLLLGVKKFSPTRVMLDEALKQAVTSEKASFLLAKIADTTAGAAMMLAQKEFMSMHLPDTHSTFRIVVVLFKNPSNRKEIQNCKHFPGLLAQMANSEKLSDAVNVLNFLSLCDLDESLTEKLWKKGFFNLCNRREVIENNSILSLLLSLASKMALKANVEGFSDMITIVKTELPRHKPLARSSLAFILSVSRFRGYFEKLSELNLKELFAEFVAANTKYEKHLYLIERNMAAHSKKSARDRTESYSVVKDAPQACNKDEDEAYSSNSYDDKSGNI